MTRILFVVIALSGCTQMNVPDAPACGDGVVDPGEQCDDGNLDPGDGCSARCNVETPLTVRWNVTAPGGGAAACPSDSQVQLIMIPAGGSLASPGTTVDMFDCGPGVANLQREDITWTFAWMLRDASGTDLADATLSNSDARDVSAVLVLPVQ
jgi:cysteine-rich repeat protein